MAKSTASQDIHLEQLANIPKTKAFLGREFLTWLWWHIETSDAVHTIKDPQTGKPLSFDAWVDDRLILEAGHGLSHEDVLKGGDPSRSDEAAAGLASGKTVKELKLGLHVHGVGDYTTVLGGDDLNPRSLKLPMPAVDEGAGEGAEEGAPLARRLLLLSVFLAAFDSLFTSFIAERSGAAWEKEHLPEIRAWIKKRQARAASATLH